MTDEELRERCKANVAQFVATYLRGKTKVVPLRYPLHKRITDFLFRRKRRRIRFLKGLFSGVRPDMIIHDDIEENEDE